MWMFLRHLRGEDINSLQPQELIAIEASLEAGVEAVRASRVTFLSIFNSFYKNTLELVCNLHNAFLLCLAKHWWGILLTVVMWGNLVCENTPISCVLLTTTSKHLHFYICSQLSVNIAKRWDVFANWHNLEGCYTLENIYPTYHHFIHTIHVYFFMLQ